MRRVVAWTSTPNPNCAPDVVYLDVVILQPCAKSEVRVRVLSQRLLPVRARATPPLHESFTCSFNGPHAHTSQNLMRQPTNGDEVVVADSEPPLPISLQFLRLSAIRAPRESPGQSLNPIPSRLNDPPHDNCAKFTVKKREEGNEKGRVKIKLFSKHDTTQTIPK